MPALMGLTAEGAVVLTLSQALQLLCCLGEDQALKPRGLGSGTLGYTGQGGLPLPL